jgi:hypothetical protein
MATLRREVSKFPPSHKKACEMIPTARIDQAPFYDVPSKLARISHSRGMAPVLVPLRPSSEALLILHLLPREQANCPSLRASP